MRKALKWMMVIAFLLIGVMSLGFIKPVFLFAFPLAISALLAMYLISLKPLRTFVYIIYSLIVMSFTHYFEDLLHHFSPVGVYPYRHFWGYQDFQKPRLAFAVAIIFWFTYLFIVEHPSIKRKLDQLSEKFYALHPEKERGRQISLGLGLSGAFLGFCGLPFFVETYYLWIFPVPLGFIVGFMAPFLVNETSSKWNAFGPNWNSEKFMEKFEKEEREMFGNEDEDEETTLGLDPQKVEEEKEIVNIADLLD